MDAGSACRGVAEQPEKNFKCVNTAVFGLLSRHCLSKNQAAPDRMHGGLKNHLIGNFREVVYDENVKKRAENAGSSFGLREPARAGANVGLSGAGGLQGRRGARGGK